MNKRSDAEHYAARLEAERRAMESAVSEAARAAHAALAEHYQELVGKADRSANPSAA